MRNETTPVRETARTKPYAGARSGRPGAGGLAGGVRDHFGPHFRRLWKQRIGPALSPAAVGEIVQRRVSLAGLEGDFGGHSLRSGFVTEASRQGVSLPATMQRCRQSSGALARGLEKTYFN
jgi:hypothetical protein